MSDDNYSTGSSRVIDPLSQQVERLRPLVQVERFEYLRWLLRGDALEGRRCDLLVVPAPRAVDEDPGRAFQKVLDALKASYGERFSTDLTPHFDARTACQSPLGHRPYAVLRFCALRVGGAFPSRGAADLSQLPGVDPDLLDDSLNAGIFDQPFPPDAYTIGILLLTNPRLVSELPDWHTISNKDLAFQTCGDGPKVQRRLEFLKTGPSWDDTPCLHLEFARSQLH